MMLANSRLLYQSAMALSTLNNFKFQRLKVSKGLWKSLFNDWTLHSTLEITHFVTTKSPGPQLCWTTAVGPINAGVKLHIQGCKQIKIRVLRTWSANKWSYTCMHLFTDLKSNSVLGSNPSTACKIWAFYTCSCLVFLRIVVWLMAQIGEGLCALWSWCTGVEKWGCYN